ncbi:MAG: DUF169 domain-containing protein [Promethearchaeia archaeon]
MKIKIIYNHLELSATLKNILGLRYSPVAVKLIRKDEFFKSDLLINMNRKYRYCQMIMEAKKGNICEISRDNITCPAAAAAFGFKPLPEKIVQGTMLKTLGLFENEEYGKRLMERMPRLKACEIDRIIALPLEKCDFTPDLIILEEPPEKIMWIALASLKFTDGRHSFDTGIFQACCVDVTVIPYLIHKVNASFGCYGCRDATDLDECECLVGYYRYFLKTFGPL